MDTDSLTTAEKVAGAGGVLAAVGTFLPWMTASFFGSTLTVQGVDGDGVYVLVLAAIAVGIVAVRDWEQSDKYGVTLCGLLMTLIAGMYVVDPTASISGQGSELARNLINPGVGLYLSALGSVGTLVGGAMGLSADDEPVQTPAAGQQ